MPAKLNEFLHFAITLLLSTPSLLHHVWIEEQASWDTIAAVLSEYGLTDDEIAAVQAEVYVPVQKDPAILNAFSGEAQLLAADISIYDPNVGAHPNLAQAAALISILRAGGMSANAIATVTSRSAPRPLAVASSKI